MKEHVEELIKKAIKAEQSYDAREFAHAALNAANAFQILEEIKNRKERNGR